MNGHVHDSFIQGSIIFAFVLLFGLAWHLIAAHTHESGFGKAMSVIY